MHLSIQTGYIPGCIGRIAQLHAHYYHPRVGFGLPFEGRVALELAAFCDRYDPTQDGLWLAVDPSTLEIHGSIAIDGAQASSQGAHLRWFITSDAVRGSGVGTRLLNQAMAFCLARPYAKVHLSTFEGLHAARHLYENVGFQLVHQAPGRQWGTEVNEQIFERTHQLD
jgi:GNAT superfamily N-acetyltransferase